MDVFEVEEVSVTHFRLVVEIADLPLAGEGLCRTQFGWEDSTVRMDACRGGRRERHRPGPVGVALDPTGNHVYVTNNDELGSGLPEANTVPMIDTSSNAVTTLPPLVLQP
jgi:hypothetical protein